MLPFKSGDEVLREMRTFSDAPVIVVYAKDTINTKVNLLHLGADDYVTKPFDLNEILARIESNLRRYSCSDNFKLKESVLTYKDIILNKEEKKVTANGIQLTLTSKEYNIFFTIIITTQKGIFKI